jgi:hypothetical protein
MNVLALAVSVELHACLYGGGLGGGISPGSPWGAEGEKKG